MKMMSIDLEMNQPSGKIIEIGIVVGDINTGEVVFRTHFFVDPKEQLSDYIKALTTIQQEDVDSGMPLLEAYNHTAKIYTEYNCQLNCITWGGGDSHELFDQVVKEAPEAKNIFGRRWVDVKTLYQVYCLENGIKPQAGLSKAMSKMGKQFVGKKHRAEDDAFNTFTFFCHLKRFFKNS